VNNRTVTTVNTMMVIKALIYVKVIAQHNIGFPE
jgi:hypothetical protein